MQKVTIYLKNCDDFKAQIIFDGIKGKSISSNIQFVPHSDLADMVLDCEQLNTHVAFDKHKGVIFKNLWDVFRNKNTIPRKGQKKIRRKI